MKSRKAFTLLELMVVVAIMAALATLSVGGYRALAKGMKDRSAIVAVQTLVDAARQRAGIDRSTVAVYFYDELLQKADDSTGADTVGRGVAVAVRPAGRISAVDGQAFYDEFADLDKAYSHDGSGSGRSTMRIYKMSDGSYADVDTEVVELDASALYLLTGEEIGGQNGAAPSGDDGGKLIRMFGFKKVSGASFSAGDMYGGEFASVTLPDGYYFGSSAPTQVGRARIGSPMTITPSSAAAPVTIYAMKAGSRELEKVGTTTTGGN